MLRNNDLAKTVAIYVLLVVLAVSAYFNYQYFKDKNISKKLSQVQNEKVVMGSVTNIAENAITVDAIGTDNKISSRKINVNNETLYQKMYMGFIKQKTENATLSDIQKGSQVTIYLTNNVGESNLTSKSVIIDIDNVVTGKIKSINSSLLVLDVQGKYYDINLVSSSLFYDQTSNEEKPDSTSANQSGAKIITVSDLSNSNNVTIFLTTSLSESKLVADTILKINLK